MESEVFGVDFGLITAAHDLKAPLSLMRQLALSLELEQDPQDISRTANRMVTTSERALRQVNDLLKVARLGDAMFELEPTNPRRVCDEVINELWQLFRFNRREVSIDYRNRTHLVAAHHDLLYSVIYNFCLNAMNYSGEETPSQISIRDRGGCVRVAVRDYGPCIPTNIWREIRDGHGARKPLATAMRPGSSGLGLFIASRFIEHMRGRFGVTRHRDGTSFFVELPISRQLTLC